MAEHTPGPWRAYLAYADPAIVDHDGRMIAMVTMDEDEPQELEEVVTNARLIAAAPELLEVAKKLAAWESDPDGYGGDLAEIGCMARAAIAKAEGRGE